MTSMAEAVSRHATTAEPTECAEGILRCGDDSQTIAASMVKYGGDTSIRNRICYRTEVLAPGTRTYK